MTDLSPQAQQVLDATYREMDYVPRRHVQWAAAAALLAAAEQMPANYPTSLEHLPEQARRWYRSGCGAARNCDRLWLCAIAAELAGTTTTPDES